MSEIWKTIVVLALVASVPAASALADSSALGGTYNVVSYQRNGSNYTGGGGSFDVSSLNGENLPWAYCVDLRHYISRKGNYPCPEVRSDGAVNGAPVNNAGTVAWLLGTYASEAAGDNTMEAALQGLICEGISRASFTFAPTAAQNVYFAPCSAEAFQSGDVGDYRWPTPHFRCDSPTGAARVERVQGLVTYRPVPEPGSTLLLLGAGLVGLSAWRRRPR